MRLAATRLQDKRQANKRCVKGCLYIISIFLALFGKFTSSTHASNFSADSPWIFGLENALLLGWHNYTEANFACASSQLRAKPTVFFASTLREQLFELKNEEAIKKSENLSDTCPY